MNLLGKILFIIFWVLIMCIGFTLKSQFMILFGVIWTVYLFVVILKKGGFHG